MNFLRAAPAVLCAAVIATAFSTSVKADDWNQKTVITFSQPVETPGIHIKGWAVLPAGTYVFKLLGSPSDRHIVQIFNQDETMLYATVLAIPDYRLRATGKTVLTFSETPPGQPDVLRAWFYPGKNFGDEFVYPKQRALDLAKATNSPVLYTPAEIPVEVTAPITSPEEPVVVQLKQAPVLAVKPTGEDVEVAQVVTAPPAEALVASNEAPAAQLPKTASSMPLIALVGLLTLFAAFTLRFARARKQ
jgi:LPXTG-motif cell wall-anchored protein